MPRIMRLQSDDAATDYLPPVFYLKFTQEEFPDFLANPSTTMQSLGHPVKNLTVAVKDHVWDARNQEWVTDEPDKLFADAVDGGAPDGGLTLPPAEHWEWWCGYQDEMCICERVLVP